MPSLKVVQMPPQLQVSAAYGVLAGAAGGTCAGGVQTLWIWRTVMYRRHAGNGLFLAMLACAFPATLIAQDSVVLLEVTGQVATTLLLDRKQLLALKRVDFTENRSVEQGGKSVVLSVTYQGVLLRQLLDTAGLKPDRRDVRKAVALLTERDGYRASFSWGELYNSQVGDGVVLVLRHGPDELLDTDGAPSVRSLQDLRPGPRHVRWLSKIEVLLPTSRPTTQ